LPVVAVFTESRLFGQSVSEENERYESKFLAVRILRLINTIQLRHFEALGHYADLAELKTSESTERWLNNKKAEKTGLGRSLYSVLHFERKEIVPGWEFEIVLRDDRRSYVVTMKDSSGKGLGAFSTDQEGIIYEGTSLAAVNSDEVWQSAQLIIAGKPIETHDNRGLASLLKTIAFGPVPAQRGCCTMYPCQCFGSCQSGSTGGLCTNCGCPCCVWCCNIY